MKTIYLSFIFIMLLGGSAFSQQIPSLRIIDKDVCPNKEETIEVHTSFTYNVTDIKWFRDRNLQNEVTQGVTSDIYGSTMTGHWGQETTYYVVCEHNGNYGDILELTVELAGAPVVSIQSWPDPLYVCEGQSFTLAASGANSYVWKNQGGTILGTSHMLSASETSPQYYTVTGTGSCGLTHSKSIYVTASPSVGAPTIEGDNTGCSGSAKEYNANAPNATSYAWSLSPSEAGEIPNPDRKNVTVNWAPGFVGEASLSVSAAGCNGPKTTTKTVVISEIKNLSVSITDPGPICNSNYAFVSNPVGKSISSYKWYKNGVWIESANSTGNPSQYEDNFSDGDKVYCTVTSDYICSSPAQASSNIVTFKSEEKYTPILTISNPDGICYRETDNILFMANVDHCNILSYKWEKDDIAAGTSPTLSIPASQIKQYDNISLTVTVSSTEKCLSTKTLSLSMSTYPYIVSAPPTKPVINSGETDICAGTTTTYLAYATNASAYVWSLSPSGAGTLTNEEERATITWNSSYRGNATIFVHTEGLCGESSDVYSFNVKISASSSIPVVPEPYKIVYNTSATLTASGASDDETYQWYDSGFNLLTSNETGNLTKDETFYVKIVSPSGCESDYTGLTVYVIPEEPYNYIKTTDLLIPERSDTSLDNLTSEQKAVTTNYFDGLGRLIQTVDMQASPSKKDVVQIYEYDNFGRQPKKYLPYACSMYGDNGGSDGSFKGNALADQALFYTAPSDNVINDNCPYSLTRFENSPLGRVLEQGAPGYDWQPSTETDPRTNVHTVAYTYGANANNEVRLFGIDQETGNLIEKNGGLYNENTLYKNQVWDENGNLTEEFKDNGGNVVLKRTYVTKVQADGTETNLTMSTYYVYDDMGLLRIVIPPKANGDNLVVNGTDTRQILDGLCYQYTYDDRMRMVSKKLPGAGEVKMVYDNRDRLRLVQDSKQAAENKCSFTKYDNINRPVITGTLYNVQDIAALQPSIDGSDMCESRSSDGGLQGYTNSSFPNSSDAQYHTITYYDNYAGIPGATGPENASIISDYVDGNGNKHYLCPIGQVTATNVLVLEGGNNGGHYDGEYLNTTTFYDNKMRAVQVHKEFSGGGDKLMVNSKYDFVGNVLQTVQQYTIGSEVYSVEQDFVYGHRSHLLSETHSLQGIGNNSPVELASMQYNGLGELVSKTLGEGIQQVNYTYNIRGWLKQINNPQALGTDKFAMNLYYNSLPTGIAGEKCYNGNIAALEWKGIELSTVQADVEISGETVSTAVTAGKSITVLPVSTLEVGTELSVDASNNVSESNTKVFAYTYDGANRLTYADYNEHSGSTWSGHNNAFDCSYGYDLNGNIDKLSRMGESSLLDDITYTYERFSNRLLNTTEGTGALDDGFYDGNTTTSNDYAYYSNGALMQDLNKGISYIGYNEMNLPKDVSFDNGNSIKYIYTGTGEKLKKVVDYGSTTDTKYYYGSLELDNSKAPTLLHTTEGFVDLATGNPIYQYSIKDHLGNVRALVAENGDLLQSTEYYPFGSFMGQPQAGGTANKYLYNGKELQDDNLNGINLDWYDYGWRMYDPAIARWHVVDPEAESYFGLSPYNYCLNNPVYYIDPDGRKVILTFENDKAKEEYVNTVNNGLEGQYTAKLKERKDGSYNLKFKKAKGGSYDGLSDQGKGFYDEMNKAISDKTIVNMDVVWDDPNTVVGSYQNNTLDMKDVLQGQPSGTDYVTGTGMTQIGLITHETAEQLAKAKRGLSKGEFDMQSYKADHQTALKADEKVDFLHRDIEVPGIRTGEVDIYHSATTGNQVPKYPLYPPTTIRVGSDPKKTVTITPAIPAQRIK